MSQSLFHWCILLQDIPESSVRKRAIANVLHQPESRYTAILKAIVHIQYIDGPVQEQIPLPIEASA